VSSVKVTNWNILSSIQVISSVKIQSWMIKSLIFCPLKNLGTCFRL